MKSLFFRMFLCFCGGTVLVFLAVSAGFTLSNPDLVNFNWPRVGGGAIVSAGHLAAYIYERRGQEELSVYLQSVSRDIGIRGALMDSSGRQVGGEEVAFVKDTHTPQPEGHLALHSPLAEVRVRGPGGAWYTFVANVPRRESSGFWSRAFLLSFVVSGGLLCYLLAWHVSSPLIHLRELTSRFSQGDLRARVTAPRVLRRSDEIGGLARDFNHMASRMETLIKAQQRLNADVSHELRSPITRLGLALGLIRRKMEPASRSSLARMEREIERLNSLITQLLTLSRLECLDQPPPEESIALHALVQEIAADADFEAASMGRSVRIVENTACSMRGSPDLIRSAVENVVRNAVKYTGENTEVSIRVLGVKHAAIIEVADEGPGVPAEALDHMFQPFYRVDEARDRSTGGVGLGLAIARQIVALHGGSIHAANRDDAGLQVRISLPVEPYLNGGPGAAAQKAQ